MASRLVAFHERLLDEQCAARFPIPDPGIEIAAVGSVHVGGGTGERLAPFRAVGNLPAGRA